MPESALTHTNIGFFGKLPTNGDFIHRNLSTNFVTRWDHWLQNGLAYYQSQDSENWLNNYLTSPIWRFLIPPSLLDEHAYFGILAPSVDNVGRYFPLTIAASIPPSYASSVLCESFQNILSLIEESFLNHLHANNSELGLLEQDIALISHQLNSLIAKQNIEELPESLNSHQFVLSNDTTIAESASSLWLGSILQRHAGSSLWWTKGSHSIAPSMLFAQGLPSTQQYAAMLSNFQNQREWRTRQLVTPGMSHDELSKVKSQLTQTNNEPVSPVNQTNHQSSSELAYPPTETESLDAVSAQDILSSFQSSGSPNLQDNDATMPSNSNPDNTPLNIQSFGFSDVGNKRTQNQDAILVSDSNSLWVVADGMGGHFDGDKASQEIAKQLSEKILPTPLHEKVKIIRQTIENVNSEIFAYAQENRLTCGSTVVLMTLEDNNAAFLWAGDSRLYMYRQGSLAQLSSDHSMFNLYKDSGLPTDNIQNNAITRAVGVDEKLELDIGHIDLMPGDRLMLCSDGLHDPAGDDNIRHALSLGSPQEAAEFLKKLVLAGEAKDNLSGVFVWL